MKEVEGDISIVSIDWHRNNLYATRTQMKRLEQEQEYEQVNLGM